MLCERNRGDYAFPVWQNGQIMLLSIAEPFAVSGDTCHKQSALTGIARQLFGINHERRRRTFSSLYSKGLRERQHLAVVLGRKKLQACSAVNGFL